MDDDTPVEGPQLDPAEERDARADLDDLTAIRGFFEPQGVKGVVVACPDCGEDHFYEWELLRENLEHFLQTGETRMHEPAFQVAEDDYIGWDYGRGYVDAITEAGLAPGQRTPLDACPWCLAPADATAAYCARCGRSLAPARILAALLARGLTEREARELLVRAGVDPFP
ncbi:MAG: DUF5319 family protein [Actinomycetota bacterium]